MTDTAADRSTDKTDTLTWLLDVLGDSLEDVDASGASVAGRAHLSRFHFDRMVSAALGEAPGAFRRRRIRSFAELELPCASDVHYQPPGGCVSPPHRR